MPSHSSLVRIQFFLIPGSKVSCYTFYNKKCIINKWLCCQNVFENNIATKYCMKKIIKSMRFYIFIHLNRFQQFRSLKIELLSMNVWEKGVYSIANCYNTVVFIVWRQFTRQKPIQVWNSNLINWKKLA